MKSSNRVMATSAAEKNKRTGTSITQLETLHKRLYHAFNLGTRSVNNEKERKWKCTDIEIQRCVVRSIASFLDCISGGASCHPLVKGSVADMVGTLVWILEHSNETVLGIAANVVVKLISTVPNVILQSYLLDLVHPLSSLLSFHQLEVSISCATALNMIFLNLSVKGEKKVWEIMTERRTVFHIISSIREFSSDLPIEYFREMASLLGTILHRWPPSRYPVWIDAKLMEVLGLMLVNPDFSIKAAALKLCSALALCGHGAKKLLENGDSILRMMVCCMDKSHPLSVRIEGFRLAQCLMTNKQGCIQVMNLYSDPIIKAIIDGMSAWAFYSRKIPNDHMSLLVEACRLALITRWTGEYNDYFWKQGIYRVLLNLIIENFQDGSLQHFLSFEELIPKVQEALNTNFLLVLRPYVWDIVGWLATNCRADYNPRMHGHELHFDILIMCACLSFADSMRKGRQLCQNDINDTRRSESASRAVLMMIYSPCKYILSKSRFILSEILKSTKNVNLEHILQTLTLNIMSSGNTCGIPDMLQTTINLVALTCYCGLPKHQEHIVKAGGIKTFLAVIKWCLSYRAHMGRPNIAPRLQNISSERSCCWVFEDDWEGNNVLLLYGLLGLAVLLHSGCVGNNLDIFAGQVDYTETQFVSTLQEICNGNYAPGVKWYAASILSFFGLYGFPSKLGRRMGEALNNNEHSDLQLILANGDRINVHGVILAIRCPPLLPSEELPINKEASDGSSVRYNGAKQYGSLQNEICLSSQVNRHALSKLLEFIYLGYLHAGEELVKKLKILAKHCRLQPLFMLLRRECPKWGTIYPTYDLSLAISPAGHHFSDIILEAKAAESICWTCSICSQLVPHMHVHKVVLQSSCDYLRALFQSGMQESHSQTIKVPISWGAMLKLVTWFYTDKLPAPPSGCVWDNMDTEERLCLLQPYLELCWLAELWCVEDVQDISYRIVTSALDSSQFLAIKMIKIAADLSLWMLVEVAANFLAPSYRQLHHSGDLEGLDEELIDMIRIASVQLSQKDY